MIGLVDALLTEMGAAISGPTGIDTRPSVRAPRRKAPLGWALSLAMIDVDNFKQVNDRHGHPTGDRVLQELARFLRQRLRQGDVVARYGGEEFAVVMSNTDGAIALMVMDRLRSQFATLSHEGDKGESFPVTFSAGVAALTGLASARELVLAADRALYEAKDRGRDCAVLSSVALTEAASGTAGTP